MNSVKLESMADFIARLGITMQCLRAPKNPNMADSENMTHWRCTLTRVGHPRTYSVYFSMGSGFKEREPSAVDVLDSLASDAAGVEGASFEDWCANYGYDTDNRKAEKTFNVCRKQAYALRAFLGHIEYETLLYKTERE